MLEEANIGVFDFFASTCRDHHMPKALLPEHEGHTVAILIRTDSEESTRESAPLELDLGLYFLIEREY